MHRYSLFYYFLWNNRSLKFVNLHFANFSFFISISVDAKITFPLQDFNSSFEDFNLLSSTECCCVSIDQMLMFEINKTRTVINLCSILFIGFYYFRNNNETIVVFYVSIQVKCALKIIQGNKM